MTCSTGPAARRWRESGRASPSPDRAEASRSGAEHGRLGGLAERSDAGVGIVRGGDGEGVHFDGWRAGDRRTHAVMLVIRARQGVAALGVVLALSLSLGFDLDRGELHCEQAANQLLECCPDLHLPYDACVQAGGCERANDDMILSDAEAKCLTHATCDQLEAAQTCTRLESRIEAFKETDGPSLAELYRLDDLCE